MVRLEYQEQNYLSGPGKVGRISCQIGNHKEFIQFFIERENDLNYLKFNIGEALITLGKHLAK